MSDQDSEFNTKALDNLIKAMASKGYQVKIGILGQKNSRKENLSNATIGAAHEYGTSKIPRRSFLRMPIIEKLPEKLKESNLLDKKNLENLIKNGNTKKIVEEAGVLGVSVVLEAFDSSGFGTWTDLAEKTLEKKKVKQILVETHQLRDSIDFRIEEKS